MNNRKNYLLIFPFVILFFLLTNSFQTSAQEAKCDCKFKSSVAFQSRYVWRGLPLGGAFPSIQPTLEYNTGKLAIGAFGAFSLNGTIPNQEIDLYASYTFLKDMLTFTFTDYYFPMDAIDYDYFNYSKDKTTHVYEAALKFNGTAKLPFTVLVATNIYGNDARKVDGKINYSTYFELGYLTKLKETNLNIFLGSALNAPGNDLPGFYANTKTGIVNLGLTASKEIQISDKFSLPVSSSLIFNPYARKIYFVFGFTL